MMLPSSGQNLLRLSHRDCVLRNESSNKILMIITISSSRQKRPRVRPRVPLLAERPMMLRLHKFFPNRRVRGALAIKMKLLITFPGFQKAQMGAYSIDSA